MVIGLLTVELEIEWAHSLKDKRKVLQSLKERVRKRFNVSIAEVADNEVWNIASLGIAVVSNQQRFANQVLSQVLNLIDQHPDCETTDCATEFIQA